MADVRGILVVNDHHEWVSGVYTRVGEPRVWITLDDPAYVEWAAKHQVHLPNGPARPLVRLLVWAAVQTPWGTWDNTANPVRTTQATTGECVQLTYTIGKYGCTGTYTSITYTEHDRAPQHVKIEREFI